MKNNINKFIILSSMLLSLNGCAKNSEKVTEDINQNTTEYLTIQNTTEQSINENTTEYNDYTTEYLTTEMDTTTEILTTETINNDEIVIQNFNNDKEELNFYLSDENIDMETVKEKGKAFFIKCVDFIFYDSTVNGVTFNELSEDAKKEIFEVFVFYDELITSVAPNYKENISEKYEIVKDFANEAYYYSLDKIKNFIGEEKYDKIGEIKNEVINNINDTKENSKIKIKNWYEDFKSN